MRLANLDAVRRVGIFFFYDGDGVADETVTTLLDGVQPHFERTIVVVNGALDEASRAAFEARPGTELLQRENQGFDSWAYKTAIEHIGWDGIAEIDELVLYNFTILGPVASVDAMFADMDARDLDFWGLTVHHGAPFDPWGLLETPTLPEHLQSHWIAVRASMLQSAPFRRYWDELPPIPDYAHAVAKHEARFTHHFASFGFRWEPFVDTADLRQTTFYPLNSMPVELIRDRGCPIFKRKTLFAGIDSVIDEHATGNARELYRFLAASGRYDMGVLDRHLARSADQRDVFETMHEWRILAPAAASRPSTVALVEASEGWEQRVDAVRGADRIVLAGAPGTLAAIDAGAAADLDGVELVGVRAHPLEALADAEESLAVLALADGIPAELPGLDRDDRRADALESLGLPDRLADAAAAFDDAAVGALVSAPALQRGWFGELGHEADGATARLELAASRLAIRARSNAPVVPQAGAAIVRGAVAASLGARIRDAAAELPQLSVDEWGRLLALAVQDAGLRPQLSISARLAEQRLSIMQHQLRGLTGAVGRGVGESYTQLLGRIR
ncbi:rhamnan synthesis F family protein [Agrococcus jenensis]|uniref:Rhamnan synthesis protein F n=1 Tax=Agrococcus jenensis TaxID=46353 RepID=A0A3N2APB2_9MICO|nr:rhamnan synthesis F family protein [Agrococcus jenensis]ROR64897.1 rhamnan synthesis protein F [Agrococcus jenensis]